MAIPAQTFPAVLGEQVVTRVPHQYADDPFMLHPGRALVVGQTADPRPTAYVLDSRQARRNLRGAAPDARLLIPRAYHLDQLTLALLWAVANFDAALLADDALLAAGLADSYGYARMSKSAVSRDLVTDASTAGRMWLGSQFCADHIRRHATRLTDTPVFWTREQRGEEAATWLLFTHKYDYLRETSGGMPSGGDPIVRVFCIPSDAVADSPAGERALLLLAVALMESCGIHTAITDAPELAGTAGFVTDRHSQAITATWVGADGIWYVDVADDRATLHTYRDATGHAINHCVIAAPSPHERLRNLAAYLDLDWAWLTTRCSELALHGTAGLAQPRSRLLSLDGVDQACRFLAKSGHYAD
ncbi:XRE family transcriptional regulator [Actinoplanes sp. NPDC049118]|uniref:XRE family transcriptional regulator n=1 Tax=Actinoplanes sp. NPDC049118 TaxID=3155769 RepID=UPI00340E96A6